MGMRSMKNTIDELHGSEVKMSILENYWFKGPKKGHSYNWTGKCNSREIYKTFIFNT